MTKQQYQLVKDQLNAIEQQHEATAMQITNIRALLELVAEDDNAAAQTTMHLNEEQS
jgi:phage shock protein A